MRAAAVSKATSESSSQDAASSVSAVQELQLPIGWSNGNAPDSVGDALLNYLPGWLITIAAISLGAPFWFDLLGRLVQLRASGATEADADTAAPSTKLAERLPAAK